MTNLCENYEEAAIDDLFPDGTTYYLALCTSATGTSSGLATNEVSGNGYARQAVTLVSGSPAARKNTAANAVFTLTGAQSGITHWMLCAGATAGVDDGRAWGVTSSTLSVGALGGSITLSSGTFIIEID